MSNTIFDKHISLLGKTLDLRSKKNDLISSNIANRETPGYRAQDLVFEKELSNALHSDRPSKLKTTDSRHIDGMKRKSFSDIRGRRINSFNPSPSMDGNTVDLDKEMAKLAENQLVYNAAVQMINKKFTSIKSAINNGGR